MPSPAAYVSKRLERLAAEIRVELKRPTVQNYPTAELVGRLGVALHELDCVVALLAASAETPATVSEGVSDPMRFAFLAVGRDAAGRDIYAQDEAGTVWAGAAFDGIARAHRFPTRAAALSVAETRGGYAYPLPA